MKPLRNKDDYHNALMDFLREADREHNLLGSYKFRLYQEAEEDNEHHIATIYGPEVLFQIVCDGITRIDAIDSVTGEIGVFDIDAFDKISWEIY